MISIYYNISAISTSIPWLGLLHLTWSPSFYANWSHIFLSEDASCVFLILSVSDDQSWPIFVRQSTVATWTTATPGSDRIDPDFRDSWSEEDLPSLALSLRISLPLSQRLLYWMVETAQPEPEKIRKDLGGTFDLSWITIDCCETEDSPPSFGILFRPIGWAAGFSSEPPRFGQAANPTFFAEMGLPALSFVFFCDIC